jgi:ribosomal protein S6--L-glutamate ligase/tetrahydromethanopterin:alpha-L-glutamate ligase
MEKIKTVILGSPGAWHTQTLTAALRKRGVEPVFGDAARLQVRLGSSPGVTVEATFLSDADLVLVREVPGGTLEQVIYRMDALHQLENGGVRVINSPYAIEKMVDKYYALSLLQDAGLRVPETRLTESPSEALEAFHSLGGDVVVKPLFGSRGVGMVRVTETDTAGRVFRALQLGGYVYYLQKYIPHNNRDQRVMVIGEECVAAMERVADSWKTNIAAGAWPIRTEVTSDVRDVCLQAARRLEADYCGVDLLRSEAGELFVLEVNSMPAWQGLQEVTPFDVADRIVKYCFDVIQRKS